jgi:hypothetical protein
VSVLHLHTADRAVLDQDAPHPGVGEHLAAGLLDFGNDGVGHAPGTAHRVIATVQVVTRDHRVHQEGRPFRRQAHIAPLPADRCDQVRIGGQLPQYLVRGSIQEGRRLQLPVGCRDRTLPGFQQPLHGQHRRCATHFSQQLHVTVDGLLFSRKLRHQVVAELLLAGARTEHLVPDVEAVIFLVHRRPFELTVREEIEHPAGASPATDIANVMHANVPFVTRTCVRVRVAAGRVVLFQHADCPAELAEQRRRGQAADAGPDHQGVVGGRQAVWTVTAPDSQGARFQSGHVIMLTEWAPCARAFLEQAHPHPRVLRQGRARITSRRISRRRQNPR